MGHFFLCPSPNFDQDLITMEGVMPYNSVLMKNWTEPNNG